MGMDTHHASVACSRSDASENRLCPRARGDSEPSESARGDGWLDAATRYSVKTCLMYAIDRPMHYDAGYKQRVNGAPRFPTGATMSGGAPFFGYLTKSQRRRRWRCRLDSVEFHLLPLLCSLA
jgi:hypothetical protein